MAAGMRVRHVGALCALFKACSARFFTPTRLLATMSHKASFGYDHQEAWKDIEGCYADGFRQSPIDVNERDAKKKRKLTPLSFRHWDCQVRGTFHNNGHSVQFNPDSGAPNSGFIDARGVPYDLVQFHFHWGRDCQEGSEHYLDGRQYSGEVHFVHKKRGGTATDIDSLSVVGVLCQEGATGSPVWDQLVIPIKYDDKEKVTVTYRDLMPDCSTDISRYFRYEGSLTTPPCSEIVQWLLLKDHIHIPAEFLSKLRTVQDESGCHICHNFRKLQKLNAREVGKTRD